MPCIQDSEKFLSDIKITCLERPGNSSYLNPIEKLWAVCKGMLRKLDSITKEKTLCAVIRVWFHDPKIKETRKKTCGFNI
jgi:transposase